MISKIMRTAAVVANPNFYPLIQAVASTKGASETFEITGDKLYFPVVTLSMYVNIKLLEKIRQVFKRKIFSNKHRSEIPTQPKIINLGYIINPTSRNINRLFALSFKNCNKDRKRDFLLCITRHQYK